MKIDLSKEEAAYKAVQALKKSDPALYDTGVLFNQNLLTACGQIHAALLQLDDDACAEFKADNTDFFEGFEWTYYMDWRKTRAKSCAHCLDVYQMLNVKFGVQHFVGETFYAGIPVVTEEEVNCACQSCDGGMKIGIDGQLHKTDKFGEFEPWSDPNDIYGDGTGVTTADLQQEPEPEYPCLCMKCKHMTGDGSCCIDPDNHTCFEEI